MQHCCINRIFNHFNLFKILRLKKTTSDWLGMAASLGCLVHCTAGSLILLLQPVLTGTVAMDRHFDEKPSVWHVLFFVLAVLAVWRSYRKTNSMVIRTALWSSLAAFGIGALSNHHGQWLLSFLLYGGSVGLVVSHYFNLRQSSSCAT